MRVLLRQITTKHFFRDEWNWIFSPREARTFTTPLDAYRFAKAKQFPDVEVVLFLEDGQMYSNLPVK